MAKGKNVYTCTECGAQSPKWQGQCPDCGAWNSMVETVAAPAVERKGHCPLGDWAPHPVRWRPRACWR